MSVKFDAGAAWNDAVALLKTKYEAFLPVAGALLFLPQLVAGTLVGQPDISGMTDPQAMRTVMLQHFTDNWPVLLLVAIASLVGSLAIYMILVRRESGSIGDVLLSALKLLPLYFVAAIGAGIVTGLGFLLLFIPGFYLMARFIPLAAVATNESGLGIGGWLSRSWNLTKDNGWRLLLYIIIIAVVGFVLMMIFNGVLGFVVNLLGGFKILSAAVDGVSSTVFGLVFSAAIVAAYRQLAGEQQI